MNYPQNQGLGIPIGSGAMESQCSQNQNRFKRHGQLWSDEGGMTERMGEQPSEARGRERSALSQDGATVLPCTDYE